MVNSSFFSTLHRSPFLVWTTDLIGHGSQPRDVDDALIKYDEIMNAIRKGQVQGVLKGDVGEQVMLVAWLFGRVA
jgi:hypothetical protein